MGVPEWGQSGVVTLNIATASATGSFIAPRTLLPTCRPTRLRKWKVLFSAKPVILTFAVF